MITKKMIHPKVKKLADSFGVEFRVGATPAQVGIALPDPPKWVAGCYVGYGVVFVNSNKKLDRDELQIVLLHELGHAILEFFPLKISKKAHEIKANAIALAFAAQLRLPVPHDLIQDFGRYTKTSSLYISRSKKK